MALFPFFIDIKNTNGIIIGGNKHALEKIQRIKPYGPNLHIISQTFLPEIEQDTTLKLSYRKFKEDDLNEKIRFVIVASDDRNENHKISQLCKEKGILVNVVDDKEYCDFIFPSLIHHGNLSIGICTNGSSPATGVILKRKIEEQIPDNIEEILDYLHNRREIISNISDKKIRFKAYYKLSELCLNLNRPLNTNEWESFIQAIYNPNE